MSSAAQKVKDKGNAAFRAENYPEAIGHYTEAMLADSKDPTYPLNRAAAYLRLGKAVDAERDCSTALRLSPGHVKALYRRAQARIELGKLKEAKSDLSDALNKEAGNSAVKSELQRVENLLAEAPKSKSAPIDVGDTVKPVPTNRRRVPIEIVEADGALDDTTTNERKPTSSRSPQPSVESALPSPLPSPARETSRTKGQTSVPEPQSTKPTPSVRGGIFRPTGQHTFFGSEPSQLDSQTPTFQPRIPVLQDDDTPRPSPLSLFEFTRTWEVASPVGRWDLLCKIPPQSLPALFKTSLEATLLAQILEVCYFAANATTESAIKAYVHSYLKWLQRVPRFSTVALFLSKQEKEISRTLADTVEFSGWKI